MSNIFSSWSFSSKILFLIEFGLSTSFNLSGQILLSIFFESINQIIKFDAETGSILRQNLSNFST